MKKYSFKYEGKTGIAESKGFQKKELAELSCNIGNVCEFGCAFCYVPAVTTKQKYVQDVLGRGHSVEEFSLYRTEENVVSCVEYDLKRFRNGDKRTVFFCTTCDPCATNEQASITISAIRLIMESSDLQVRVLSKSTLILDIAKELQDYHDRIVYSLSTGTIRPDISACIEGNASPVRKRIETLNLMQDKGFRTFGMLCPILPSEIDTLPELMDAIRPQLCEYVWAEAINVRGKSLVKTFERLSECSLDKDAIALKKVMGNKLNWQNYSKELFSSLQAEMRKRGVIHKLRFLQYVNREPLEFRSFFESRKGAICL